MDTACAQSATVGRGRVAYKMALDKRTRWAHGCYSCRPWLIQQRSGSLRGPVTNCPKGSNLFVLGPHAREGDAVETGCSRSAEELARQVDPNGGAVAQEHKAWAQQASGIDRNPVCRAPSLDAGPHREAHCQGAQGAVLGDCGDRRQSVQ